MRKTAVRTLRLDAIPGELKERAQWVCWRYVERDGKRTKPPYQTIGDLASSTNPATWTTFAHAVAALEGGSFDGIGFVLTGDDPYTGFDLDHCGDASTGVIAGWAQEIIGALNSYTEITPSGEGLRIIVRGTLPPGGRKKGELEVYDEARYVTLTGRHVQGTPTTIEDRQAAVERIHARYFEPPKPTTQPRSAQPVALQLDYRD